VKLKDLIEAEGGEAAVDVGNALQSLHDQDIDAATIALYETLCMKLIKCGADATVLTGELEFAMPFFNVSMVLTKGAAGFKKVFLDDVEDIVYDARGADQDAHLNAIPLAQAAAIDWQYLNKALYETKKLREYIAKAFKS
jgi:hypothetical protein